MAAKAMACALTPSRSEPTSTAAPPDRVGYVKDRFGIGPIGSTIGDADQARQLLATKFIAVIGTMAASWPNL